MNTIGSYVFFDTETTGLPYVSPGDTKITEMTLIGVAKSHFEAEPFVPPRVVSTLTLCLNPMGHISHEAARITGLSNELLDIMRPFDEKVYNMMVDFIERLPQPVCLLAHNGDRFDFPVLQSHLKSLKLALPDNLLCGDTLKAFRSLKVMDKDPQDWRTLAVPKEEDRVNSHVKLSSSIDQIEMVFQYRQLLSDDDDFLFSQINEEELISSQPLYSTPRSQLNKYPPIRDNSGTDVRNERTPKAKRQLFTSNPSYKLNSVHQHVIGSDIANAHMSQSDSLALLNIVAAIGLPFHQWIQENSVSFSTIRRLW